MEFLDKDLTNYVESHTFPESSLLKKLTRDTHANILMPRMLSGHFQGRVLSMISHMVNPLNVLEIGTYTGYSALCLAEGLRGNGKLITIDINEELESMVRKYIKEAGFENKIDYCIGNALDIIKSLNLQFDIVFIDADKENYIKYYDLVFDKVRKGGFIIADNVLWSGKVVGKDLNRNADKDTKAILEFNEMVHSDERVENVLLPIRDGLMILRKF